MSTPKKLAKMAQKLIQQILQLSRTITKTLMNWLLRGLFVLGRSSRPSQVGFVLPTVVMVTLVVTLLVTAIMVRSFDRARNASNIRVSERVLTATGPAIDRANAKIKALLADPILPRGTPTDQALYQAMSGQLPKYTLGDETPLKLVYDINGGGIDPTPESLDENETLTTAWRFPVDTDNNGRYDSFTHYGVYFRNPTSGTRARTPLEARTLPMDVNQGDPSCGGGTSAALVGSAGWSKTTDGNLRKSFYIFAATVPISNLGTLATSQYETYKGNKGFAAIEVQQDQARIPLTNNAVVYEDDLEITAGAGIRLNGRVITNGNLLIGRTDSPIRFYQVSSRESCYYNAENGKIAVGGNVILGNTEGSSVSPVSVDLFKETAAPTETSFASASSSVNNAAIKASFNSKAYAARINDLAKKALDSNEFPREEVENVVRQKLNLAVNDPIDKADPRQEAALRDALQNYFKQRTRRVPFAEVPPNDPNDTLALTGAQPLSGTADDNDLRAQDNWIYPVTPGTNTSTNSLTLRPSQPPATDPATLTNTNESRLGDRILVGNGLPSKWWKPTPPPAKFVSFYDKEPQDIVGTTWTDSIKVRQRFTQMIPLSDLGDTGRDGFWERNAALAPKQPIADAFGGLRVVTGAGIYSHNPAVGTFLPRPPFQDDAGSLGVNEAPITDDPSTPENESVLDDPNTQNVLEGFPIVFPDSMPMWEDSDQNGIPSITQPFNPAPGASDRRGDLVGRATAVYHYRESSYDPDNAPGTYQRPIACVSSYYDPSTPRTATNRTGLPDIRLRDTTRANPDRDPSSALTPVAAADGGLSNNGVSYTPNQTAANIAGIAAPNNNGLFATVAGAENPENAAIPLADRLTYQANLIFPNGRFVNQQLRQALRGIAEPRNLTLAEQSAIDSTLCALQIADGTLAANPNVVPHGAIYETAFLDARQVKGIESETPWATGYPRATPVTADYDLDIAERQPLEIRATVIDLDLLRRQPIVGAAPMNTVIPATEYLLPDSGIIYASRDDALPDLSVDPNDPGVFDADTPAAERMARRNSGSPVDFLLDPTRRPNGIMLINGSVLARGDSTNEWKDTERGLILATNLPAYVRADTQGFNLHQKPDGNLLEEFTSTLNIPLWNNFYTRTKPERDPNFACRKNQPGLNCNPGDLWRPATVLSDAVTLLSNNFRFGFRNEGDYDLRKNIDNMTNSLLLPARDGFQTGYDLNGNGINPAELIDETATGLGFDVNGNGNLENNVPETQLTVTGIRLLNGFFDNNYLTSSDWVDPTTGFPKDFDGTSGAPVLGSSYVNNFVTPIQRRSNFREYVMEMCRRPLIEQCQPQDWVVGLDTDGDGLLEPATGENINTRASDLVGTDVARLGSGTTARLALPIDGDGDGIADPEEIDAARRYPRRVAFSRTVQNQLILDGTRPRPIGIATGGGTVAVFPYTATALPRLQPNALWFRTTNNSANPTDVDPAQRVFRNNRPLYYKYPLVAGTTQQPVLAPVIQLRHPESTATTADTPTEGGQAQNRAWVMRPPANGATFNLIMATGDNPTRDANAAVTPAEQNGGMPNLPIFLESWRDPVADDDIPSRISGSFIQYRRSIYATAPFLSLLQTANPATNSLFGYRQFYSNNTSLGRSPFYTPPKRQWGYDVGLLSQAPDLFAQQITTPSAGEPNKYYREVGRDDLWVNTLLCGAVLTSAPGTPPAYGQFALTNSAQKPPECKQDIGQY